MRSLAQGQGDHKAERVAGGSAGAVEQTTVTHRWIGNRAAERPAKGPTPIGGEKKAYSTGVGRLVAGRFANLTRTVWIEAETAAVTRGTGGRWVPGGLRDSRVYTREFLENLSWQFQRLDCLAGPPRRLTPPRGSTR